MPQINEFSLTNSSLSFLVLFFSFMFFKKMLTLPWLKKFFMHPVSFKISQFKIIV